MYGTTGRVVLQLTDRGAPTARSCLDSRWSLLPVGAAFRWLGACLCRMGVRAAASRLGGLPGLARRLGGLEHEELDCEVGVDVILAHERDHLPIELSLDDSYKLV